MTWKLTYVLKVTGKSTSALKVTGKPTCVLEVIGKPTCILEVIGKPMCVLEVIGKAMCVLEVIGKPKCVLEVTGKRMQCIVLVETFVTFNCQAFIGISNCLVEMFHHWDGKKAVKDDARRGVVVFTIIFDCL